MIQILDKNNKTITEISGFELVTKGLKMSDYPNWDKVRSIIPLQTQLIDEE